MSLSTAIKPPERLTISEWADKHRFLPSEGAHEAGRWRTSRFPFLKRIMDVLSPQHPCRKVSVMKGAQLGFTEVGMNFALYTIDHAPAPMLFVQKTIENVTRLSKQRLDKSIRLCPTVFDKIGEIRSRDSSNTILMKNFPGGILILGGANSAASLRSMPIQNLVLDEEDSYDADIQDEGTPSELAIRRTANFPRRKIFRLSTPAIRETSIIEPNFEDGSKERYQVPCPSCGHYQVLWWPQFKWDKDDPSTIKFECAKCAELIDEHHKTYMLEHGKWVAENPDKVNSHPSFHISSLYSPIGFFSWKDAAEMFIRATRTFDRELLKVFVNTVLGETWTEAGKTLEASGLMKRRELYTAEVPQDAFILSCGVDVQEDRIEAEVVGWGRGWENWSITYERFMGDTEREWVWTQLDDFLQKTFRHESGVEMPIAVTGIDSGHRAKVVYEFCRMREFRRVYPVKGFNGFGKGYLKRPKKRNEYGVWLINLFVDELKSKIYSQLQIAPDTGTAPAGLLPGFCHFPLNDKYDRNFFRGLTAEVLKTVRRGGRNVLAWELPKGRRNEPLDCRAYATGAMYILNPNMEAIAKRGKPVVPSTRKAKKRGRVVSRANI
jgi:phage terminase large subunit GpA-like protein